MGRGSGVAANSGVGHRGGSDLVWLWLWHRLVALAPIQPLAWELPDRVGAAQKKQEKKKEKRKKKKKKKREREIGYTFLNLHKGPLDTPRHIPCSTQDAAVNTQCVWLRAVSRYD